MKNTKLYSEDDSYDSEIFDVSYIPEKIGSWSIDIDDVITSSKQFKYAIKALENADEENPVVINLQSPGGSADATDTLIHAMRKCQGHIHIIATGNCSSAATLILLEADTIELSEGFNSLLHCGSLGQYGNYNEFVKSVEFSVKSMERLLRRAYEGFLSPEEIEALLRGQDIWLDRDEWIVRHNERTKYFHKKNGTVEDNSEDEESEEIVEALWN